MGGGGGGGVGGGGWGGGGGEPASPMARASPASTISVYRYVISVSSADNVCAGCWSGVQRSTAGCVAGAGHLLQDSSQCESICYV